MKTKHLSFIIAISILLLALAAVILYITLVKKPSTIRVGDTVTLHVNETIKIAGTNTYIRLAGFSCEWCELSTCNAIHYEMSTDGVNFVPMKNIPFRLQTEDMDCKTFVKFILQSDTSQISP